MATVSRKKPSKPERHFWQTSLIKATPARYLGRVEAADEEAARELAAEGY